MSNAEEEKAAKAEARQAILLVDAALNEALKLYPDNPNLCAAVFQGAVTVLAHGQIADAIMASLTDDDADEGDNDEELREIDAHEDIRRLGLDPG